MSMSRQFAPSSEFVTVWVDAVSARTSKAALVVIDGHELWIPLAAVDGRIEPGAVEIAAWLVRKEHLPPHEGEDPPLPDPSAITMFSCRPKRPTGIGRVKSRAFGAGTLIRIEGDKSVVHFDSEQKTRTLASRYLEPIEP
jgi:hypothetical protein